VGYAPSPTGFIRAPENFTRFFEEEFSLRRDCYAARTALEQVHTDLIFQVLHLTTQRRLRDAQLRCGLGEVQRFTYGHEVTEMPQFHFSTSSCLKSIAVQAMWYWAKQTNARKLVGAKMKKILLIESSPRGNDSYSHHAARSIVNELQRRNPGAKRTVLGFIGITDVEVVRVEPVANSAIGPEKSLASARTQSKHVLSPTRINNNTKQATINKKQQIGGPLTRRRHKQKKKRKKL